MKTDAEREESFPLLLSTKIPLLKSTRQEKHFYLHKLVKCDILHTLTFTHIVEL